ncbi:MAG: YbhB/YbcL family Raf kinase inhibitor-like protein [Minisyncoccia bacterium]
MKKIIFSIIIIFIALGGYLIYNNKKEAVKNNNLNNLNMTITSPNFKNNEFIPKEFSCDGQDLNPELHISNVPKEAKSLVLIVDDPDAPMGTWTHWTVWNISPDIQVIKSNQLPVGAVEGQTDFGRTGYGGPCPPAGKAHRYFFKLYALDIILNLQPGALRSELEKTMQGHIISQAELIGLYQR